MGPHARTLVFNPVVIPPKPVVDHKPEPREIADDFESSAVGALPQYAAIWGGASPSTVIVTDEKAAEGEHSLKFTDTPGPQHAWEPELGYRVALAGDGAVVSSFDVLLEPKAVFYHELRASRDVADTGPRLVFNDEGKLLADDTFLMDVPRGVWFHVELVCPIGAKADGAYTLTVTVPGQPPKKFDNVPCFNSEFNKVDWAIYQAFAETNTAFYLDNVRVGF